jgi:hypothetical protein
LARASTTRPVAGRAGDRRIEIELDGFRDLERREDAKAFRPASIEGGPIRGVDWRRNDGRIDPHGARLALPGVAPLSPKSIFFTDYTTGNDGARAGDADAFAAGALATPIIWDPVLDLAR